MAAYQISAGTIKKYSQNLLQSSVENQASQIEAWLNENLASFQMAKTIIEDLKPSDEELKTILDGYYGYNSNYPEGLYVADSTGQLITASESTKKESDVTNSTWYKEGLTRVNMAVGSAYQNADGVNVISASGILNDGSDKVRVISADMTLDRIAIIVNSFIEMNDAEAFLVDKTSGVILANRDSSLISQTLGAEGQSHFYQLTAEKAAEKDYNFATLDGNMTVFQEVDGTNWLLISYIPTSIVLSDLTQLRNIMIAITTGMITPSNFALIDTVFCFFKAVLSFLHKIYNINYKIFVVFRQYVSQTVFAKIYIVYMYFSRNRMIFS